MPHHHLVVLHYLKKTTTKKNKLDYSWGRGGGSEMVILMRDKLLHQCHYHADIGRGYQKITFHIVLRAGEAYPSDRLRSSTSYTGSTADDIHDPAVSILEDLDSMM